MITLAQLMPRKKGIAVGIIVVLVILLLWFEYQYLPIGVDWVETFRPAAIEFMAGRSPYTVVGYFNPPWMLIPFIPLALLPIKVSNLLLVDIGLLCYLYVLIRLRIRPLIALIFLLFPTTIIVLHEVNIEWLVMLGFVLPPQVGLFFVLLKPQVGLAIAIYWFFVLPKKIQTFLPVVLAFFISIVLYKDWLPKMIIRGNKTGYYGTFDISFFPYLVPLGLVLLFVAIRKHKAAFAYMASPFLAPYIGANSYTIAVLGLCKLWSDHLIGLRKEKNNDKDDTRSMAEKSPREDSENLEN